MLVFPTRYPPKGEKITFAQGRYKSDRTPQIHSESNYVCTSAAIAVEPGSTYLLTVEPSNISFPSVFAYTPDGSEWGRDIGGNTTTGTKTVTVPEGYTMIGVNFGLWGGYWQDITPDAVTSLTVQKVTA